MLRIVWIWCQVPEDKIYYSTTVWLYLVDLITTYCCNWIIHVFCTNWLSIEQKFKFNWCSVEFKPPIDTAPFNLRQLKELHFIISIDTIYEVSLFFCHGIKVVQTLEQTFPFNLKQERLTFIKSLRLCYSTNELPRIILPKAWNPFWDIFIRSIVMAFWAEKTT